MSLASLVGRQYRDWRGILTGMFDVVLSEFARHFRGPQIMGSLVVKWEKVGGVIQQCRDFLRVHCVPAKSAHAHELRIWAAFFELAFTIDQLNPKGLYCLELAARRYSLLQFSYESVPKGGTPDFSMSDAWLGYEGLEEGTAAQTPEQRAHVAKEMEQKALILKETRKANEEMRLHAKKNPAGPGEIAVPEHP